MAIPYDMAFLQNLSPFQILLVAFIVLLLFGAKRLPELGRGIGKFLREFKRSTREIEDDIRSSLDEPEEKPRKPAETQAGKAPEKPDSAVERTPESKAHS